MDEDHTSLDDSNGEWLRKCKRVIKGDKRKGNTFVSCGPDCSFVDVLAGRIEILEMTNFMCHAHLELKLNESINFITGRNGSGKSAIMAALIVVLGGSATLTGRGSGIQDFIKKGETWAKVTITLANVGNNAFKRELYGSKITISRNISKTGANSYICKSDSGSIVSKKKEEIDAILLAFNWQIKNPICILNQDVARSFLCATDSEMRFGMFTKATQLENLKVLYMKTMDLLSSTKKQLQGKKKGLEEANQEISQLKEKLALFMTLEKHVHGKRNLENEYLWSLVCEEERKMEEITQNLESMAEKREKLKENQESLARIRTDVEAELKSYCDRIGELRAAQKRKKEELFNAKEKIEALEKEIEKNEAQLKQAETKLEKEEADIIAVKNHLNQCDSNTAKNEEEKKRMNAMMRTLKDKLSELKEKLVVAERDYDVAQKMKMHHTRKIETLKSDVVELEHTKRRADTMARMKNTRGEGNLARFGNFTKDLLQAIDDAHRRGCFRKKPIGPCGLYVTLTGDSKWARAVESVIGGLMSTYCCDNQKDFQTLTQLMEQVCGEKQPTIIISKFLEGRHNVESKKASVRDHPSVLDVLTFKNDIVFNTFIDQARIETVVLFETDQQASFFMTHIQNVPNNLKMGLTLACDQYFPAPNYRTYYGNPTAPLWYFDVDVKGADALKKLEEEAKVASQALERKNVDLVAAREEYTHMCEALHKFENNIKDLKQNERKIQVELNHLKDMEDSIPVAITKMALEEELTILERSHEESRHKVEQCKQSLQSLQEKREKLMDRVNEAAKKENESQGSVKEVEERQEDRKEKCNRLLRQEKNVKSKIELVNDKLKELEEEMKKRRVVLEKKLTDAQELCPERVNTDKSPLEVQKLLEKCERYLRTAEKITGSKEDTINAYKAKLETYKNMKNMVGILDGTMETLIKATCHKLERLKILETHTANLVSFHFQATLQTRGYDGQLKVDFDKKVLELEVTPKDGADARKDSKTLSGGERSYSTVSFILAIWKVVNMPVYFLDEFDVFMDKVNRKVIMDLLLEHATAQNNKQFIFVTPHDISGIQHSNPVSIYRLPDPKRKSIQ